VQSSTRFEDPTYIVTSIVLRHGRHGLAYA
jgi:hypothetical protein